MVGSFVMNGKMGLFCSVLVEDRVELGISCSMVFNALLCQNW